MELMSAFLSCHLEYWENTWIPGHVSIYLEELCNGNQETALLHMDLEIMVHWNKTLSFGEDLF